LLERSRVGVAAQHWGALSAWRKCDNLFTAVALLRP